MAHSPGPGDDGLLDRLTGAWTQFSGRDDQLDDRFIRMLMAVSLAIGLLSTLATAFAFYWFVKMQRTFRHDLIMLLVQADLIKAVWFVIFPLVTYTRGPVASDSAFCQVSGFFFAVGIESSDVAVLLIAVHSAMYIFRPKSGLYPYRWLAYAAYVMVPLLLASLAFLDGGYENVGYFCYLPTQTGWARLALSWVPRHLLFAIIILTYSCIYVYVRRRILNYERRASTAPRMQQSERRLTLPSAAVYRDRIRSLPGNLKPAVGRYMKRMRSVSVGNPPKGRWTQDLPTSSGPIAWNLPRFTEGASLELNSFTNDEHDPHSSLAPLTACHPAATVYSSRRSPAKASLSSLTTSAESWKLVKVSEENARDPAQRSLLTRPQQRQSSCVTIPTMFPVWRGVVQTGETPSPAPSTARSTTSTTSTTTTTTIFPPSSDPDGAALAPHISHEPLTSHVSRNRDKIRRQLRTLFVYPLLYLVIWTFPLVNQAYGYTRGQQPSSSSPAAGGPRWALVLSLASLAVQGAADSAVFTAREKPWRHVGGEGFWASVRRGWWWWGAGRESRGGGGRTREEVLVEVRNARARREQEMTDEMEGEKRNRGGVGVGERRHWWDFEDDGPV